MSYHGFLFGVLRASACMGRRISVLAGAIVLIGNDAMAQREDEPRLEARPFAGVYLPTGAQRGVFATTALIGLQGGIYLPEITLTSTFMWTRNSDRHADGTRDVDVYQLDWGVEKEPLPRAIAWQLRPFVGAGLGVRIYDSLAPRGPTRRMFAGFAGAGLARRIGGFDVRTELRDHLSRYDGIGSDEPSTLRNDVTLALGLARGFN